MSSLTNLFKVPKLSPDNSATFDHDEIFDFLSFLDSLVSSVVSPDLLLPVEMIFIDFSEVLINGTRDLPVIYHGSRTDKIITIVGNSLAEASRPKDAA